jgi:hypothetical protein
MSLRTVALFALSACALSAASQDEFKRDCAAFKSGPGFGTFKSCAADFFTLNPVHPTVKSIVPGGGTGVGASLSLEFPSGDWRRKFTTNGAISFRKYWVAESALSFSHAAFGKSNSASESFGAQFYVRARELPLMPFYGLGPNSTQAGLADFSERRTSIGARVLNPLTSWIGVGGVVEGIFPDVGGISDPKVVSINRLYNETNAPGLTTQPTFVHSEIFLHPHHADPFELDYHIGYNFYHDTSFGYYSFRRFRAEARHFIYPERSGGQPHRDSMITIHGLLSVSDTSPNNAVPFYMQETLGGSNIDGEPTLRGFRDYRFRAPDLLLFQVQYDRRLWGPLGALVFYDTGKVAMRAGDIDFAGMRHSYGAGLSLWVGSKVVFRASVGLGSGEGRHLYFGIPAL